MRRTWVFGHRGASSTAPENTLAAFEEAFRVGADGIELDTQLSADGIPVVIHDGWLARTTGVPGSVFHSTLADLKKLDAGRWFDTKFAGERIPTLAEALDLARNRGIVNVEIKSNHRGVPALTDAVLRVIGTWTHPEQVLVSSFDPRVIRRVRRHAPALKTAFLRSYRQRGPFAPLAWWSGADYLDVDPPLADRAAQLRGGFDRVIAWTVDQPTEQERLAAEGILGLITNFPGETVARLAALRNRRSGVLL